MASVPYQYIIATGIIIPDTSGILVGVQDEYIGAFGADIRVSSDTPQGVLIATETIARSEVVSNNAAVANQINPNIAGGVFLDAICALSGIQRIPASPTQVFGVTLSGVASTVIPAGSKAQTPSGDLFQTQTAVVLGSDGTIAVDFSSVENGPIACDIGALNVIVSNVLGWENVINASAGVLGANIQSDQALRAYRNNTLAFQGVALATTITSALYATSGVQSLFFQENMAATTQTIQGISMVAHSVYACVNGGTDLDVAAALLENKSSGAAWNGGTSVDVVEPASGQTYTVKFDRPTPEPILIKVTSSGDATSIIQAVLDYSNGLISSLPGFVVGGDISPFEISAAIAFELPGTFVNKVEITLASDPSGFSTDNIPIAVNEIATTQQSYITVVSP